MKFLIVSLALVAVAAAQQYTGEQAAAIVRQAADISPDGAYSWSYETQNGIAASEQGSIKGAGPEGAIIGAQGGYQYTAPDGTPIQVTYTADENGFQPQGAHIPTPPPIPAEILRSLEWNAAHPEENQPQVQPQYYRPQ